jgi:hypothetical protein
MRPARRQWCGANGIGTVGGGGLFFFAGGGGGGLDGGGADEGFTVCGRFDVGGGGP